MIAEMKLLHVAFGTFMGEPRIRDLKALLNVITVALVATFIGLSACRQAKPEVLLGVTANVNFKCGGHAQGLCGTEDESLPWELAGIFATEPECGGVRLRGLTAEEKQKPSAELPLLMDVFYQGNHHEGYYQGTGQGENEGWTFIFNGPRGRFEGTAQTEYELVRRVCRAAKGLGADISLTNDASSTPAAQTREGKWEPKWKELNWNSTAGKPRSPRTSTITFDDVWLRAVPILEDEGQRRALAQTNQRKTAFLQAFKNSSSCNDISFLPTNPEAQNAGFDIQVFEGLDGRNAKYQWVLYRTDTGRMLTFGERTNIRAVVEDICEAVHHVVKPNF